MVRDTVLFVCLGNICRSPLAEGVFRREVESRGLGDRFLVESCGTGGWHVGEAPDRRSQAVARAHGLDISGYRARQLAGSDFERFGWIVAMDRDNERAVLERRPPSSRSRVSRFTSHMAGHVPGVAGDVPDPYYGGADGFEEVWRLLALGAPRLLDRILAEGRPPAVP